MSEDSNDICIVSEMTWLHDVEKSWIDLEPNEKLKVQIDTNLKLGLD